MRSITKALAIASLVLPAAGCAGNPLAGRWSASLNSVTATSTISGMTTGEFRGDGTATYTAAVTSIATAGVQATCTGALTYSGLMWSSTMTVLTVTGPGTCSGAVMCMVGPLSYTFDCAMAQSSANPVGTYNYTLTNNNMTLTVTPTGGGGSTTFTRGS